MGNTLSTDRPDDVGLVVEGRRLVASLSENKWGLGDLAQTVGPSALEAGHRHNLDCASSPIR